MRERSATWGLKKGPNFFGGSSEEYWTMNESLIQQYQVSDEGFVYCKTLSIAKIMTLAIEEVPTNFVPAVAVIRRGQA